MLIKDKLQLFYKNQFEYNRLQINDKKPGAPAITGTRRGGVGGGAGEVTWNFLFLIVGCWRRNFVSPRFLESDLFPCAAGAVDSTSLEREPAQWTLEIFIETTTDKRITKITGKCILLNYINQRSHSPKRTEPCKGAERTSWSAEGVHSQLQSIHPSLPIIRDHISRQCKFGLWSPLPRFTRGLLVH